MFLTTTPSSISAPILGALIVVFKPNHVILGTLIRALSDQLSWIYIINNSPSTIELTQELNTKKLVVIEMGFNAGIARAQNQGMQFLFLKNCDAVFLFDQDSSINENFIHDMKFAWQELQKVHQDKIGAIGPAYYDRKTNIQSCGIQYRAYGTINHIKLVNRKSPVSVDYVISSGSMIPKETWQIVGGMSEKLFAYWLDIEWGLRAKSMGFKSYVIPNVQMEHSIGADTFYLLGKQRTLHDDFRQYFLVRNPFLLLRYSHLPLLMRVCGLLMTLFKYIPGYLLISDQRKKTAKTLFQAIVDGLRNKGGSRSK